MNVTLRNALLGASLLGGAMLMTPAAYAADSTDVTTNPDTGQTVVVEHHGAILPKNRSTDVQVINPPAPVDPAPDVVGDGPPPVAPPPDAAAAPDQGPVVEQQTTTTTVQHY